MPILYEPRGKAGEYAPLAANLYRGCTHGCMYCYVPQVIRMANTDFHHAVQLRKDVLKQLERDAARYAMDPRPVLFCFTTDPYPRQITPDVDITRESIEILNAYGLKVTILSKGGRRALRDFDILSAFQGNQYAASLTFPIGDSPAEEVSFRGKSLKLEPNAAVPRERMETLRAAYDQGIYTWVSLEPVLDPEAPARIFKETRDYVKFYKLGRLNHMDPERPIDWAVFRDEMIDLFESHGLSRNDNEEGYMIKRDLLKA